MVNNELISFYSLHETGFIILNRINNDIIIYPSQLRNLKKNRHIMRQCYFSVSNPDISVDQFISN